MVEDTLIAEVIQWVKRKKGIDLFQYKKNFLESQIVRRSSHLKIPASNYLRHLFKDDAEINKLLQTLSINYTYFFRNERKYEVLAKHFLPEIVKKNKKFKKIRIWSAGCATGEEPYSIAILLYELLGPEIQNWDIRILATDVNEESLNQASKGTYLKECITNRYDENSESTKKLIQKYFSFKEVRPESIFIRYEVKQYVHFESHNLTLDAFPKSFDLILCRNVLIYIKPEFTKKIIEHFHDSLDDEGVLILGNLETLDLGYLSLYQREKVEEEIVYRKITKGSKNYALVKDKEEKIKAALIKPLYSTGE